MKLFVVFVSAVQHVAANVGAGCQSLMMQSTPLHAGQSAQCKALVTARAGKLEMHSCRNRAEVQCTVLGTLLFILRPCSMINEAHATGVCTEC